MDNRMIPLRELIQEMVAVPQLDVANTINPEHITMLSEGCTAKRKDVSGKRRQARYKSAILSRRKYCKLGLQALPRKDMTFQEALKLHHMWRDYVREALELREGDMVPKVFEKSYDSFRQLLCKMDLHGAKLEVLDSKCETLKGLIGIVLLDTKNTFKIVGMDDRLKTVPKESSVFRIYVGSLLLTFYGKSFMTRPAERSVKKVKNFIEPFDGD